MISFGIYALSFFDGHPKLLLLFVMFVVPFILNTLQYWITDSFLAGTDYITAQKRGKLQNDQEMNHLYIMQNGMIDFKKNRVEYRKRIGLQDNDIDPNNMESQINQRNVEDEFVIVNMSGHRNPDDVRKSYIVRQIEENILGVQNEDYNKDGSLDLENMKRRQSNKESKKRSSVRP